MEMYQHDSAAMFRFVLRGDLTGDRVQELEHAWNAARSTLNARQLVVDVSGIRNADRCGTELLFRMKESGARLTATLPPASEDFLRSLGLSAAAPGSQSPLIRLRQAFFHWLRAEDSVASGSTAALKPSRPGTDRMSRRACAPSSPSRGPARK